uniref:Uncharacterized protein n=1 Tax=Amphiprion percula TaxID=161767 RepID=A0A3P8RLP9_AMPPE
FCCVLLSARSPSYLLLSHLCYVQLFASLLDSDHPMVVHCSAGIGRTGVLITMETALCLMECGQPVYPRDIVRTMRDHRAMMIQTPSQYRFVCEAILKCFSRLLYIISSYGTFLQHV